MGVTLSNKIITLAAGSVSAAVTAYKLSGSMRTLYGTVLGPAARALYRAATRVWHNIPT